MYIFLHEHMTTFQLYFSQVSSIDLDHNKLRLMIKINLILLLKLYLLLIANNLNKDFMIFKLLKI